MGSLLDDLGQLHMHTCIIQIRIGYVFIQIYACTSGSTQTISYDNMLNILGIRMLDVTNLVVRSSGDDDTSALALHHIAPHKHNVTGL